MSAVRSKRARRSALGTIAVVGAFVLSLGIGGSTASASGYKSYGPVYTSYSKCDQARKAYKSSWTSTSTCFKQMRRATYGGTYWAGEYSFWIHYRH
ncbi:MAG TPA: hypothetical protein VK024_02710 [Actinomycetaceae bacterium]|nr:hypothetical protein [Actinomycetaceae bacterium]